MPSLVAPNNHSICTVFLKKKKKKKNHSICCAMYKDICLPLLQHSTQYLQGNSFHEEFLHKENLVLVVYAWLA